MTRARDLANLIGSGNYTSTTFTATAGQTVFTIAHTPNFIQVFMNGLLLDETTDYTSNGTAVTLTSAATAGDELEVVKYNTFSVGDAITQTAADSRYVNTTGDTMTGTLDVQGTITADGLTVETSADPNVLIRNSSTGSCSLTLRRNANDDAWTDWTFKNESGKLTFISDDTVQADADRFSINYNGDVVFNDGGLDADFRVESTNSANALFVEGSSGNVGIGTSSPNGKFETYSNAGVGGTNYSALVVDQTSEGGAAALSLTSLFTNVNITNKEVASIKLGTVTDGSASPSADIRFETINSNILTERMRIDSAGRVTMPYQPAFRAYRNTDPGVNTSDGNMSWSGTEFNVGNHFANNRFTAPVAGTYIFGVNNNMGSGYSVATYRLYKNGSPYHVLSYNDFTASWKNSSGSTLMQLQANDYIEAWWRGDADYGTDWCGFYGYLIG